MAMKVWGWLWVRKASRRSICQVKTLSGVDLCLNHCPTSSPMQPL